MIHFHGYDVDTITRAGLPRGGIFTTRADERSGVTAMSFGREGMIEVFRAANAAWMHSARFVHRGAYHYYAVHGKPTLRSLIRLGRALLRRAIEAEGLRDYLEANWTFLGDKKRDDLRHKIWMKSER